MEKGTAIISQSIYRKFQNGISVEAIRYKIRR